MSSTLSTSPPRSSAGGPAHNSRLFAGCAQTDLVGCRPRLHAGYFLCGAVCRTVGGRSASIRSAGIRAHRVGFGSDFICDERGRHFQLSYGRARARARGRVRCRPRHAQGAADGPERVDERRLGLSGDGFVYCRHHAGYRPGKAGSAHYFENCWRQEQEPDGGDDRGDVGFCPPHSFHYRPFRLPVPDRAGAGGCAEAWPQESVCQSPDVVDCAVFLHFRRRNSERGGAESADRIVRRRK